MNRFGYTSDTLDTRGYINKEKILEFFDEEDIFSLVFGFKPETNIYVHSPFRRDNIPNCWFSYDKKGKLRFVDFANMNIRYGIKMHNIDCFDAVRVFYDIPNFYQVLRFIGKSLDGSVPRKNKRKRSKPLAKRVDMAFQPRNFISEDKAFWQPYGISRNNLILDKVFPVSSIQMSNTRIGDTDSRVKETCYALTGFGDRLKFYFPYRPKGEKKRFITNCTVNDIGGLKDLPPYGEQLIISKAYKDNRVLKNTGRYAAWNQNEGMIPDDDVLFPMVKRFEKVPVLFDNDSAGITAAKNMSDYINSRFPNKARPVWIPEHLNAQGLKDSADLRKQSEHDLHSFLKEQRL